MTRRERRRLLVSFGMSVAVALVLIVALWTQVAFLKSLQASLTDILFQTWSGAGPRDVARNAVILAIDDEAIARLGRFGDWPRRYYAQAIDALGESYARTIAFDIGFIESHADDDQVAEAVKRFIAVTPDELQRAGVTPFPRSVIMPLVGTPDGAQVIRAGEPVSFPDKLEPVSVYLNTVSKIGHANVLQDDDGSIRTTPLIIRVGNQTVPSLALASAMAYTGRLSQEPAVDPEGRGLAALGRFIPVDTYDRMLISYAGPPSRVRDPANQTVKVVSFSDVIDNKYDPSVFRDKMVFLGLLDAAGFADDYQVPTSRGVGKMKGVEIHADAFATLVSARFFTDQQFPVTAAFLILLCLLGGLAAARLSIVPAALVTVLGGVAYFFGALEYSELYYDQLGVAIPNLLYPPMALVVSFVCITIYRVVFEQAETRATRGAMGKYLSPAVLQEVLKDPDALHLGGEKRNMTALFTDIRGFTSISEKLEPQALVALLNEYLTEMTDIVHKWQGVLDKYMGDAIMAWWGAPGEQPDHAYRACRTALEMRQELARLHIGWEQRGVPSLEMGVGINTGPMVYGNTGSQDRFDFTVLGDAVNLASRLEGVNKEYGSNVIISESTLQQLRLVGTAGVPATAAVSATAVGGNGADGHDSGGGVAVATRPTEMGGDSNEGHDFMVRPLDLIAVKGKTEPVQIYELIGLKGQVADYVPDLVQAWDAAIGLYHEHRFNDAAGAFDAIIEQFPREKPTAERPLTPSGVYAERCRELAETPPPPDWDGVYVMTHK